MEEPVTVTGETPVVRVAHLMTERDLAQIDVLAAGAVAGTVAYADVVRHLRRPDGSEPVATLAAADPPALDADDPPPAGGGPAGESSSLDYGGPFEPDVLTPSQYLDRVRRRAEYDPELRLMVAVLQLGVSDYLKHAGAQDPKSREAWQEIEAWVEDRDASWLYSFENVCHVLELDPDYVRRGLRTARATRAGTPPADATPGTPEAAPGRDRAGSA